LVYIWDLVVRYRDTLPLLGMLVVILDLLLSGARPELVFSVRFQLLLAGMLPRAHPRSLLRLQDSLHILWWGSMVTPADTPDFGAIVLPVPIPLLYFRQFANHS
jgi:hypothetical protein